MTDTNTHEQETSERVPQYVDSSDQRSGYSTAIKTGGTATDVIGRLLWIGVLLGAMFGLFNFMTTFATHSDMSTPQLAALAAECLAIAVLPYVLARAWDEVCRPPRWR
ncbi:MAG TPA: hypothetical protein DHU55_00515 [Blastocatellia bacterium]|jgi:hypothetical protein|nr:hypothetical protein [Blastocatellia bacterium]HCX28251.1 hypothetical protein [Blastocatellia bacterium]